MKTNRSSPSVVRTIDRINRGETERIRNSETRGVGEAERGRWFLFALSTVNTLYA
jgi:hypothetical protein